MGFSDPEIQIRIPARDPIVLGVSRAGQGERAGRATAHVVSSPGNWTTSPDWQSGSLLHQLIAPAVPGRGQKKRVLMIHQVNVQEFYLIIKKEIDMALLVFDGDQDVWLPRSQIAFTEPNKNGEASVWIPEWLASKKELI